MYEFICENGHHFFDVHYHQQKMCNQSCGKRAKFYHNIEDTNAPTKELDGVFSPVTSIDGWKEMPSFIKNDNSMTIEDLIREILGVEIFISEDTNLKIDLNMSNSEINDLEDSINEYHNLNISLKNTQSVSDIKTLLEESKI